MAGAEHNDGISISIIGFPRSSSGLSQTNLGSPYNPVVGEDKETAKILG